MHQPAGGHKLYQYSVPLRRYLSIMGTSTVLRIVVGSRRSQEVASKRIVLLATGGDMHVLTREMRSAVGDDRS